MTKLLKKIGTFVILIAAMEATNMTWAQLDDGCIINVLNRTVTVAEDGSWSLPNIPSNQGVIRARATCQLDDGTTQSGETDYFRVVENGITDVGNFVFGSESRVPTNLSFSSTDDITIDDVTTTVQLAVTATYADGVTEDATAFTSGINYSTSNPNVITISGDGLISINGNGVALVIARKDGVLATRRVQVATGDDLDGDGIPDDYETANGLNPDDPVDAFEDNDGDGLSALEEFQAGTDPRLSDTDGDGIDDGEELVAGEDGFITNALLADTDGDGLSDLVEITVGSDPTNNADTNLTDAVVALAVTPANVLMTFNNVDTEVSTQLTVTGELVDGTQINLTDTALGTSYTSSDLSIVSFGTTSGEIFGGSAGTTQVTVRFGALSFSVPVEVDAFTPTALSAVSIPGYANNVDVQGDYAFIAAGSAGLQVVDVADREAPVVVASLDTAGTAIDIRVVGSTAYIADGAQGLVIVDVSDPLSPTLVSTLALDGVAQDLRVDLYHAYIAVGEAGLRVVDITNPAQPLTIGSLPDIGDARGVDVEGAIGVVVASRSLHVIDISTPESPIVTGSISLGTVKDVAIRGIHAYVAAYSAGYRVVDISTTSAPTVVAGDAQIVPRDVVATEDFAFFAEQLFPNVVAFVNIQEPQNAVLQGVINLSPFGDYAGTGIALDSGYAYITEERFVVSRDYGLTGDTKLFIAQYRQLNDNGGIAPTIEITEPENSQVVVEDSLTVISATADDDVAVRSVSFFVDGVEIATDTTAPYQVAVRVPNGVTSMILSANASDLGGNLGESIPITLTVEPDADDDGLGDTEEVDRYSTDPNNPDTDSDGLSDGEEVARRTNPLDEDTDGDGINDKEEIDQQTDPLDPDVTAPTVIDTTPADGEVEIPENSSIGIVMSEPLQRRTVQSSNVRLLKDDLAEVAGSVRLLNGGSELLFVPDGILEDFTDYTLRINNVRDTAGNLIVDEFSMSFTTGNTVDTSRPTVVEMTPVNRSVDVPVNVALNVKMSEDIDPTTVTEDSFYVVDSTTNERIAGVISVADDRQNIRFLPNTAFLVGRVHNVVLTSQITDFFSNALSTRSLSFTTSFGPDGQSPDIQATTVTEGETGIPLNAALRVRFSEPIATSKISEITLFADGAQVAVNQTVDSTRRVVTLTPLAPLLAATSHSFNITGVEDTSGNPLPNAQSITFTTADEADTLAPRVIQHTPAQNTRDIPLNALVELRFDAPLDPAQLSVEPTLRTYGLYDAIEQRYIAGSIELLDNNRLLRFTPQAPLKVGHQYTSYLGFNTALFDSAGNRINPYSSTFYAGSQPVSGTPVIDSQNISDNASDIPVNAPIIIVFDRDLGVGCVATAQITLSDTNGTVSTSREFVGNRLTIMPTALLDASTQYTLNLQGLCDLAGNQVADASTTFTTWTDAVGDAVRPVVNTIVPARAQTNVAVDSDIVITFSEPMDETSVDNLRVSVSGIGFVAGTTNVNGNVATFTSLNPLPGNRRINVDYYYMRDVAGNTTRSNSYFTTADTEDNDPPQVTLVTPTDGTLDVGPRSSVVLTFNESLNSSTVNATNFKLFSNGAFIAATVTRSADNRSVTLTASLPATSVVSVVATSGVQDLSGNALADFTSVFSTGVVNNDSARPSIVRQYPTNGAALSGVQRIVLYSSEPLDEASVTGALRVAQDGVLIPGNVSILGDGQAAQFVPDSPFTPGTLIQVYLQSTALDNAGNALYTYQGSFREIDTELIGEGARPIAYHPANTQRDVPLNPQLQVRFSEPLDPDSITDTNVYLDGPSGRVASTVSLSSNNRIINILPSDDLTADSSYRVTMLNDIVDDDGDLTGRNYSYRFYTGINAVQDTQQPTVVAFSPISGSENIGLNAVYSVRFDEPMNPLGFLDDPRTGVTFSADNREVQYTGPDVLLPASTQITETVPALADIAGNPVIAASTSFTTGLGVDVVSPDVASVQPPARSTNVPINTAPKIQMSEAIDPSSVMGSTYFLLDSVTNTRVDATVSVSPDGQTLTLMPNESLLMGRLYSVNINGVKDLNGNASVFRRSNFTTDFNDDLTPPAVEAVSFVNGSVEIPLNGRMRIRFDETIQEQAIADRVSFTDGSGTPLPVNLSFDSTRRILSIVPVQLLAANSAYAIEVSDVLDTSGNAMLEPISIGFTTAASVDTSAPKVVAHTPKNNVRDVPRNAVVDLRFDQPLDPAQLSTVAGQRTYGLWDAIEQRYIAGTVELLDNNRVIRFTPAQLLNSGIQYTSYFGWDQTIFDSAGNRISGYTSSFFVGTDTTDDALTIDSQSIDNNAVDVPINAPIILVLDRDLSANCVADAAISLTDGAVTLDTTLAFDRNRLTVTPNERLNASTEYTLRIQGLCDITGNVLADTSTTFTTWVDDVADTVGPAVNAITPSRGETAVPVNTPIVVTFSEPIDPTSADQFSVSVNGAGNVAGTVSIDANVVTFMPASPLPGASRINVSYFFVRDIAGNTSRSNSYFDTADTADTEAPQVTSVTPADGTLDVGTRATIVLTFNESLSSATVNNTNFRLFSNGAFISTSVTRSPDNRSVTLTGSLPASSVVSVVATSEVKDLSGNPLADFASVFTTGVVNADRTRPSIVRQYPSTGSSLSGAQRIVLYSNEALDQSSVANALRVTENGLVISGVTSLLGNGQAAQFVPDNPFTPGTLVEVFLPSTAIDIAGNALFAYQGSFREIDTELVGEPVRPVAFNPSSGQRNVPLNPQIQVRFSEPLNAASVDSDSVSVSGPAGAVTATVSLSENDTVLTIEPEVLLTADSTYRVSLQRSIADDDGDELGYLASFTFTTGIDAVEDTQRPTIVAFSPLDGSLNVGLNAIYTLRFDEPVNPLSLTSDARTGVTFSSDNREVQYTAPGVLLAPNSEITENAPLMTDVAGNPIVPASINFMTGNSVDVTRPEFAKVLPPNGSATVAVNAEISVQMNEAIDANSITGSTFSLYDNVARETLPASIALASDGRTLALVPDEALLVGQRYDLRINGVKDLSGNPSRYRAFYFTTASEADTTAPTIEAVSFTDGTIDIPTNGRLRLRFSEPIQDQGIESLISLVDNGGTNLPININFDSTRRLVTLVPVQLLEPGSTYAFNVASVKDRSGNALLTPLNISFTTTAGVDIVRARVEEHTPVSGATDQPLDTIVVVRIDSPVDPASLSAEPNLRSYGLYDVNDREYVSGTVSLSENNTVIQFTPDAPLSAGHQYSTYLSWDNLIFDLAGNPISRYSSSFFTGN